MLFKNSQKKLWKTQVGIQHWQNFLLQYVQGIVSFFNDHFNDSLSLQLGEPVYGELKHQGYLEYMAPGVVVSISYIMATGLTALAFILERRDGLFERSLVAGVDTLQILIAHAMTQIIVMVVQIMLVLVFTFLVFDIPSRGPFEWVILLLILQGCTGMAFGEFIFFHELV